MTLRLAEIRDLAYRFVPGTAADRRLYDCGPRSWWPAHEIGHFLVATCVECRQPLFGLDLYMQNLVDLYMKTPRYHYVIAREIAATSISQRLLRRSGHTALANEEIQYTDEDTLERSFERWCKRSVEKLLTATDHAPGPGGAARAQDARGRNDVLSATPRHERRSSVKHAYSCSLCRATYDPTSQRHAGNG